MTHKLFNAISFRIALIFSLSTIIILMIMGLVIHQLVMHHFETQDRTQLEGKIQLLENLLEQNPKNTDELKIYLKDALVGHHDLIVQIERPTGQIIFSSAPAVIKAKTLVKSKHIPWIEWEIQNKTYRGLVYKKSFDKNMSVPTAQIIVGIDTSEHQHFLNDFRRQLLYIGVVGTICLMFLGWFAAWRGLRPVQKMAKVAEGISAQHLSERLAVDNTPTELKSLAIAFNDMLDRLETAVEKLSDFSSDLAHEIRTPINNLMTQTQVCLSRSRDINTYQEVLFSNLEEFERLARMVSDMLFLAKAEHGLHLPNLQQINLVQEISALFDFYDAIAAEKGMSLEQSGQGYVEGDPSMLRRALSNLLSNAIKYGKPDTVIKINCRQNIDTTIFTIENESSPITSEQLNRLFDRFYRTDASRQRVEEGTGLGLAITKSILDVHGATIQADYNNGRIAFQIIFKR
ncbi:TPA: HAMP domain-containing protein [Acinetobacter nosocomialis]|uniref:Sensor protein n=1 Tax=Acinetobacter baumannii TaxID=470 RepID=A0A7U7KC88_ACIBA|nr:MULTISPECIES: heavy metal sensor histidine kinase [Acinetobacter calcoaceticus/baumannii complex]EKX8607049.1 heavy metal sensor histidine kinase [Acinetobacter baumannii]MBP1471645.1 heavy metal sensor histidine kinase [Acinetobacter nosocomialis]MBR7712037.1 heavy metal sensor histidine kinase [Acinetobacter nosocomialis]MCF1299591.1 heavy metal sensor histidine kinase [Acinetobacter baumannii]MCZ3106950.1 heavy metal sensor histidine kinase [Acinetobacter baumannii]